jgi:hypothetical protein
MANKGPSRGEETGDAVSLGLKAAIAAGTAALLGVPMVELWQMLVLLTACIALACSHIRLTWKRAAASVAVIIAVAGTRSLLPAAAIQEGHNIFLVASDDHVLRGGLPPAIYEEWRELFEAQYPLHENPEAVWHRTPPLTLFASSSDALWSGARYSRAVDAIGFDNLGEFRGGFVNDLRYNFVGGDPLTLTRGFQVDLPFFVMYELSPAVAGSTLRWRGTVYWQRADGSFEKIVHLRESSRTISAADAGRRIYAFHLPAPLTATFWEKTEEAPRATALAMHLDLGPRLVVARVANHALGLLGILALFLLLTHLETRSFITALAVTTAALVMMAVVIHFSNGKFLGAAYPPHGGGDDGLSHESTGRNMARLFMGGDWKAALRGEQSVYWDTPGMRHFRFAEKILFGDTNLGYAAFVALLPWFVYLLVKRLTTARWALAGCLIFLFCPLGSLSFIQYIQNAKLGYAEAVGFGLFTLGSYLLVRSQPRWRGMQDPVSAFLGGACLAAAMFVRPNLALAVPVLGLFFVAASWRDRDTRSILAAAAGLACALWMPLHNYAYGGQFVLISAAGSSISIPVGPMTYIRAVSEAIGGNVEGDNVTTVTRQVTGWLTAQPRLPVAWLQVLTGIFLWLRLATLAVAVFVAVRFSRRGDPLAAFAWSTLAVHVPMLFVFASAQFRYAMIGWDLSAIVALVLLARTWRTSPVPVAQVV